MSKKIKRKKVEHALVIIKPDGVAKRLVGNIINKFYQANLGLIAAKVTTATRAMAQEHYLHIKGQPFYQQVIEYLVGKYHSQKRILILIYSGKDAIRRCREIAGVTNPEEAVPYSIRGAYGRITTTGVFENVVHVSSDPKEAAREVKLWFSPEEIDGEDLYPTRKVNIGGHLRKIWM